MSNVDKYVAEISNAAWRTDKTARWAEILERAFAEQLEEIAAAIEAQMVSAPGVDSAEMVFGIDAANIARNYGKDQS